MKSVILDACSAINLSKANALEEILKLDGHIFSMGPLAQAECKKDCPVQLTNALTTGKIATADDSRLPAASFAQLLDKHRLGDGETECLTFAEHNPDLRICTDDSAARKAAEQEFGRGRVCGSLSLLKDCVRQGIMSQEAAWTTYRVMKAKGAYLPDLPRDFFGV